MQLYIGEQTSLTVNSVMHVFMQILRNHIQQDPLLSVRTSEHMII